MDKKYILTFSISVLVLSCVVLLCLTFLTPQQTVNINSSLKEYNGINKNDYAYTQTKDINVDNLVTEYTITNNEISKFKGNYQYVPGNTNPFSPASELYDEDGNLKNNTNSGSSSSSTAGK